MSCYRIYYARVVLILSPSPGLLLSPSLSFQLIAFHRGNELLQDLLRTCCADSIALTRELLSPSLSTQLIAFHRGNGCYRL